MTVIAMDGAGEGATDTRADGAAILVPRVRLQLFPVRNTRTPTELGYILLQEMAHAELQPADLARLAHVSPSTMTRLTYGGVKQPDPDTLMRLGAALAAAVAPNGAPEPGDVDTKQRRLLAAAGYRFDAAQPQPERRVDALAMRLDLVLAAGLEEGDERYIRDNVDRLLRPYEQALALVRRSRAG